jgi:hypothetical protein
MMTCRKRDRWEQEDPVPPGFSPASGACVVKKAMHPDDFAAHLAWVTAKRFHEYVPGAKPAKKPVGHWMIG